MGSQNYFIRQNVTQEEVDQIYVGVHNYFSIKLHHGDTFTKFPDVKYQKGKLTYVDLIDIDKFSLHVMEDVMYDLGYGEEMDNEIPIYYHYLVPNEGLDFGLRALGNDADVIRFSKYVGECKLFNVYTEHGKTNLHTYFCSPSKVRLEVLDDDGEVDVLDTGKKVCSKLLLCWAETGSNEANEANIEEQMGNIEPEPSIVYQPTFEPTTYVPELSYDELESFDPFEGIIEEHMGEEQEDGEEEDEEGDEETSEEGGDETSEEGGDETSEEGVEEGSEQRRHKKVSKEGDVDYIVDEENKMDDVAVDMTDFRLNVDGDVVEDEILVDAFDAEMMDNELFDSAVFESKQAVKKMLTSYIVSTRRNIKTIKDDKGRLQAKCKGSMPTFDVNKDGIHIPSQQRAESSNNSKDKGSMVINKGGRGKMTNPSLYSCTWVLYVSKVKDSETWMVKTFNPKHKCLQTRNVVACTAEFLSEHLVEQVEENPHIPVRAIKEQFQRKFELGVSMMKAFRAKQRAMQKLHGDYSSQYGMLRDYLEELVKRNHGTTVKIEVEPCTDPTSQTRQFRRIYVCLGSLKRGFKEIGRDLLGIDGAFMKGPFPAENTSSWTWFLKCLGDDLDLTERSNFTFVSDRQKGIIQALEKVFPCAEHRYCLRHIHENMKLNFKGLAYKEFIWKLASATTEIKFYKIMEDLKKFNNEAAIWLSKIPPKHWSRSHFSGRAHSDVLLNNMCESLNSKLVDGRDKPIITALEFIREYLMRRIVIVLKVIDANEDEMLTPYAKSQMEAIKKEAAKYTVAWNGGEHFQVSGPFGDQRVVDMRQKTCACRRWELTGIPCRHTVAAIWNMEKNTQGNGLPEHCVHQLYMMETWRRVYSHKVFPINGKSMWPTSRIPTTLTAPKHHKPIGRPRKVRRKSKTENEDIVTGTKLNKKNTINHCQKCGNRGHNSRTCKGQKEQS
ncbi:hypothetical protein QVD17_19258 [Tagetes erecta]|uniref:SWIM-type domain-containing protein n=1 Tax=Tagetes erecta TaxID=13708 RepID=A0AAD8NWS4_TARER|nr:hypothetical protein QVD17_19258 [Tagetes erecta]